MILEAACAYLLHVGDCEFREGFWMTTLIIPFLSTHKNIGFHSLCYSIRTQYPVSLS